jgi:hypothetical protein
VCGSCAANPQLKVCPQCRVSLAGTVLYIANLASCHFSYAGAVILRNIHLISVQDTSTGQFNATAILTIVLIHTTCDRGRQTFNSLDVLA